MNKTRKFVTPKQDNLSQRETTFSIADNLSLKPNLITFSDVKKVAILNKRLGPEFKLIAKSELSSFHKIIAGHRMSRRLSAQRERKTVTTRVLKKTH